MVSENGSSLVRSSKWCPEQLFWGRPETRSKTRQSCRENEPRRPHRTTWSDVVARIRHSTSKRGAAPDCTYQVYPVNLVSCTCTWQYLYLFFVLGANYLYLYSYSKTLWVLNSNSYSYLIPMCLYLYLHVDYLWHLWASPHFVDIH